MQFGRMHLLDLDFLLRGIHEKATGLELESTALFHVRVRYVKYGTVGGVAATNLMRVVVCDCRKDDAIAFLCAYVLNDVEPCITYPRQPDPRTLLYCQQIGNDPCIHQLYVRVRFALSSLLWFSFIFMVFGTVQVCRISRSSTSAVARISHGRRPTSSRSPYGSQC